jgi:hypothetical protein
MHVLSNLRRIRSVAKEVSEAVFGSEDKAEDNLKPIWVPATPLNSKIDIKDSFIQTPGDWNLDSNG